MFFNDTRGWQALYLFITLSSSVDNDARGHVIAVDMSEEEVGSREIGTDGGRGNGVLCALCDTSLFLIILLVAYTYHVFGEMNQKLF